MSIEVPCPQCGAILKAPPGMGGRKARCKKCQHGFRLPGESAPSVGEESVALSVSDAPAFGFDGSGEAEPAKASARRSTIKGRGSNGKSGSMLIVLGVGAVVAAGIAAAVVLSQSDKPVAKASASAAPKAEPEKDKKTEPKDKAKEADVKPKEKDPEKQPVVKGGVPKASDKKPKTVLTGGFKLPPPPAKAEMMTKPLAKGSVEAEYAKVRKLFAAGGENPVCAVVHAGGEGFQGSGAKDFVDRFNMVSGERIDRTEVIVDGAAWPRACDLSPNGDVFISESPAGLLTVYDLSAKAKVGESFKPFVDEKTTGVPLAAALFADEKTVIVAAKDGRVEVWNAREGKKLGAAALGSPITSTSCAMKPKKDGMLVVAGNALQEVPIATVTPKVILDLPHGGGDGLAMAMDDTDRVAVAYRATVPGLHHRLVVARLGDPKPTLDLQFDESNGPVAAINWDNNLATIVFEPGPAVIYELLETRRPIFAVYPAGGARSAFTGTNQYLLLSDGDKKCLLLGIDFPPNDYLLLQNEAIAEKKPLGYIVNGEGYGR